MGSTITEKILARAAGLKNVHPGQNISVQPDFMIAYDFPGYTNKWFKQLKEDFGIEKILNPERILLFIDHMTSNKDKTEFDFHEITRKWAVDNHITLIEGQGIGHQVISEIGYILPGKFLVHFDGHMSISGAFSSLGWGIRNDLLEAWLTGSVNLDVPASIRVRLDGNFNSYVNSRDLVHHLVKTKGSDGCINKVIEFGGPASVSMNLSQRQTLCSMAMFTGGISAIFNPDSVILDFAKEIAGDQLINAVSSDLDAEYSDNVSINLSAIEPQVVLPGSSKASNTVNITEVVGKPIQRGFIGSCASGRLEDIRAASTILKGKKIASNFKLIIAPSSEAIRKQAAKEGLFEILEKAGAIIGSDYCDYCYGYKDPLINDESCISTGVLNIPGRMGSIDAKIYMANPWVIAASSINGFITDPRDLNN
jgi:3-isopropylmalate/(R)-2-methylmalate dehydratase large subunit